MDKRHFIARLRAPTHRQRQWIGIATLFAILIALMALFAMARGRTPDIQAIAFVNNRPVAAALYQTALADLIAEKQTTPSAEEKRQLLNQLIDDELLIQKGLADGLLIVNPEIRAVFIQTMRDNLAPSDEAGSGEPDEATLRAYFAAHEGQFTPSAQIRISRIFVRGAHGDAAERLAAIRAALRNGEPFDDVGLRLGDSLLPAIPDRFLTLDELRTYLGPALTQRATMLETGTITDAIRAGSGWHFLYIVQRVKGVAAKFENVREDVAMQYRKQRTSESLNNLLAELRRAANIRILPLTGQTGQTGQKGQKGQ